MEVFWPHKTPPDIYETRFSYDFCRRASVGACHQLDMTVLWSDYDTGTKLSVADDTADMLLIVTDPELVLSAPAVNRLTELLARGYHGCGPVFNYTDYPLQCANMPVPYLNLSTFFELADLLSKRGLEAAVPATNLDPACIAVRKEPMRLLDQNGLLCDLPMFWNDMATANAWRSAIDTGALVHRFGPYYSGERDDLIQFVPTGVKHVLDVGCALGGYGKRLKMSRPDIFLTGVEMNPFMAEHARADYDQVVVGLVENVDLSDDFDWINCGDVLEHCLDPWKMLHRLHGLLKPGGGLVVSVPNAAHWTIVKDLMSGVFQYIPVGLQCITHLRWFTESSLRACVEQAGFLVDSVVKQKQPPTPEGVRFIEKMQENGYGDEDALTTSELILKAIRK